MKYVFILLSFFAVTNTFGQTSRILYCQGVSTVEGFKYVGTYCLDIPCRQRTQLIFDEYCPAYLDQGMNPLDQQTIEMGGRSGELIGKSIKNIIENLTKEK